MQKLFLGLMVAVIALAPAIAAAQSATSGSGSSKSGGSGGTTQADCEKAGGMWQAAEKKCAKK